MRRRFFVLFAITAGAAACASLSGRGRPAFVTPRVQGPPDTGTRPHRDSLTLLTLNVAHGRGDGFHQAFQAETTIRRQLDTIAALLRAQDADVVALQEADGPSMWSGGFDHVAHLAYGGGYTWHVRGTHASPPGLDYGTALLTRSRPTAPGSVRFAPTPPTPSKGFVVATVRCAGVDIDVVSVHLDFARPDTRARQVDTMVRTLRERGRAVVIAGDLNAGWTRGGAPRRLAEALDLRAWQPETLISTFPGRETRIDWVLTSRDLEIVEHEVLPDVVSDHRAVRARIRVLPSGDAKRAAGRRRSGPA